MDKIKLLVIIAVIMLASMACGRSTEPTPELADIVAATIAARDTASAPAQLVPDEPTQVEIQVTPLAVEEDVPTPAFRQRNAIGEVVILNDIQIVVNEVRDVPGTQYFQPPEGKKYILVDLTMENLGSSEQLVSSLLEFSLKDDTGQEYSESFTAEALSDGKSPNGTILPGDKLRGQIGYEIPINGSGFVLTYEQIFFENSRVQFDLGF